ncbi:MAG: hypothetical protein J7M24_01675 [Candidatus Latescibacteria bacterium]|nr:hypothetical protein [Candidatus Latescibacterota bacterium]
MIRGLIVGHATFGDGILHALKSIAGEFTCLETISNDGLATNELVEAIKEHTLSGGEEGTLIFVDLFGGSCWRAAKMAQTGHTRIVSGVNLPMVLSFLHKRENRSTDSLADIIETDAKRGVRVD